MKKHSVLPLIYAVGLAILLVMRDLMGIGLSKFIYLIYIQACMALATYETVVYMTCFTLPLVCGLPGTYIMPSILILMMAKRKRVNFWQMGLLIGITLMELIATLWYPVLDIPLMVKYISFAGVMLFLIHDDRELDYLRAVRLYLAGVCLLCGVIIAAGLQTAPSNWLALFAQGRFRFGKTQQEEVEGMSLILNANSMAYYSLTGIACGILCAEHAKGLHRVGYIAVIAFMIVAGFLTVSRSWLLLTVFCVIIYFLSKLSSLKQFVSLALLIALLIIVGSIWLNNTPELLEAFIIRLSEDNIETGNGRTEIFVEHMRFWASDIRVMLLGTGVSQGNVIVQQNSFITYSMHNGTQQILVFCGMIGFVIYLTALIAPVLKARQGRKCSMTYWLPLLGIVTFVQTIQFLNPDMLMLPYVIGIYALRAGGQSNEKIHHNRGHGGRQSLGLETR